MKILGIKTSHDGAMALIDNGRLIFSYEMEKLKNNNRIEAFNLTLQEMEAILNEYGYSLRTLDMIALDGWRNEKKTVLQQERENDITIFKDAKLGEGLTVDYKLAKYGKLVEQHEDVLQTVEHTVKEVGMSYTSYMHVSGHLYGAYCTSPFAVKKENSYVLVWDGGMPPQLFYYKGANQQVINYGPLTLMFGGVYPEFAFEFPPFDKINGDAQASGKIMAYIALGKLNNELLQQFYKIYNELEAAIINEVNIKNINWVTLQFIERSKEYFNTTDISHEDLLCTFHIFLEQLLIERLTAKVRSLEHAADNLCFVGGCALSIKWNSSIRETGLFKNMWVPPFPNDAGSAIGAACCAMIHKTGNEVLDWNVYLGPPVVESKQLTATYATKACSVKELAELLVETDEPVVVLNGRAELGPRSLGNRSIISPPSNHLMKDMLNKIKGREGYRPVAPICIEEDAPDVFVPGTPDPYMLFEHTVKEEWKDKLPAIVHLDGSARLQTVASGENEMIYELLQCYKALTGIPLLCNTSANFKGKGFFPDVQSVMKWDAVNYIWSDGVLYERNQKISLYDSLAESEVLQASDMAISQLI